MWENVKVCSLRYCMKWHERIHAQLTEWTNESMNQRSNVWNELVSRSINNSKNQWFSEPMTEWIGEPMNQWINENELVSSLCCTQPCQCVLSQPVANTHSRSVTSTKSTNIRAARQWERFRATPNMVVFNDFFCEIDLSLQSGALCRPHLPKVLRTSEFFQYSFEVQIELSPQSCALFNDNFPRSRPETAETCELTRFRTVTLPSYLMMGGWHGDVVDMMVWMLTMTMVRNSEDLELNASWWYSFCGSLIVPPPHLKGSYPPTILFTCDIPPMVLWLFPFPQLEGSNNALRREMKWWCSWGEFLGRKWVFVVVTELVV